MPNRNKKRSQTPVYEPYVLLERLTQEEIEKYTGKKQKKENTSDKNTANKIIDQKNGNEGNKENDKTPEKENESIPSNERDLSMEFEQELSNDGNLENFTMQEMDTDSILNIIIGNENLKNGNTENLNTQENKDQGPSNYNIPDNIKIKQEIQVDAAYLKSDQLRTQEMENMPNLSNEFTDIPIKQESQDDDYFFNYNIEQDSINMFDPSNNFLDDMVFDQEFQNDDIMDFNLAQENMFDPSFNYIPDMVNEQAVQNDGDMGIYLPQGNENMPSTSNGFVPIKIKQEFHNPSYMETYTTQENMFDPSNNFIPDMVNEQEMSDDGIIVTEILKNEKRDNQSILSNGIVPNMLIKQEIFDNGNIEIFTDVLKPLADQGNEDETP